jgi:hypothetical protein
VDFKAGGASTLKVLIEDQLYIEADSMQFIIKEYSGKQTTKGKERATIHGYFPSIASALKHIVKMKVKESTATTLLELVQDIKRIEEYIHTKLTP